MKNAQLNDLEKQALLTPNEPLSIEYNGKLVGYYYPVINHQQVKNAKEELDAIMSQILAETGLTEEEYLSNL
jgi:hypothetical protein